MKRRRGLRLLILIYVALDLSLAEMPGAFVFDPAQSVESIDAARGRLTERRLLERIAHVPPNPQEPVGHWKSAASGSAHLQQQAGWRTKRVYARLSPNNRNFGAPRQPAATAHHSHAPRKVVSAR